jgi:hypothetical protein
MTLDDVLGKIITHEMLVEEDQHVNNLSKLIIPSKKQDITLKLPRRARARKL